MASGDANRSSTRQGAHVRHRRLGLPAGVHSVSSGYTPVDGSHGGVCGRLPAHAYLRNGGSDTVISLLLINAGRRDPGGAL